MFKKTLLALALTGATTSAFAASTISTDSTTSPATAVSISSQGLPATKAVTILTQANVAALEGVTPVAAPAYIKVGLKDADDTVIKSGARLVVNITGAFFATPATVVGGVADGDISGTGTTDTSKGHGVADAETLTVNTADSTSTKLVLDLAGTGWDVQDGDQLRIGNLELITTGTEVSFDAYFETAAKTKVASTAAPATVVAKIQDQWSAGVVDDVTLASPATGVLNNQIDVGDNRETFVGNVTSDTLTFDVNTITSSVTATPTSVVGKIIGDFTGVKSVSVVTGSSAAITWAINSTKTEATYTYNTATTTTAASLLNSQSVATLALNTVAADKVSLETRSFKMDLDVAFTDAESNAGAKELLAEANAGSWTLNGVTKTVNYMPFGPNTAPIIQATSTFSEDASVSVSYLNGETGKTVTLSDVATAKANSVTKLGSIISAAVLADAGVENMLTRLVVTINAPTGKVELFTAFKDTADKDRLGVN
ncbi:hypothetical protein CWB96_10930 [Pseudoalteromonas citrea]|uniref:Uncharacterized protein n=1 Tax=Pseudoalteromonas citrea TaxID=43655 RepID=A0A5S3XQW1_9GAMM|nr:hypothetical protein [Pseudoalteromonas citrea]TMP45690.1 hypothetical protein CWB97_03575 [Pseudoalteromonas citrea]TMP59069.1 hypothetical protein CWB96_10930 [Pseudoalteromonas citrea]